MATILASKIIADARVLLQDSTGIRWPDAEMLSWLNAGQREIVSLRPDALSRSVTVALSVGSRQTIPADGHQFLDVVANANGRAVTVVPRHLMDSQTPSWRSAPSSTTVLHVIFDPRVPKVYWVYPPAASGASVELWYSSAPVEITALTQAITLDDIYANALTDYLCYRAYSKDMADIGNAERAVAHRQAMENTLQLKASADAASRPAEKLKG